MLKTQFLEQVLDQLATSSLTVHPDGLVLDVWTQLTKVDANRNLRAKKIDRSQLTLRILIRKFTAIAMILYRLTQHYHFHHKMHTSKRHNNRQFLVKMIISVLTMNFLVVTLDKNV